MRRLDHGDHPHLRLDFLSVLLDVCEVLFRRRRSFPPVLTRRFRRFRVVHQLVHFDVQNRRVLRRFRYVLVPLFDLFDVRVVVRVLLTFLRRFRDSLRRLVF